MCTSLDAFTAIPGRETPPDRELAEVEPVLVPFDEQTTQVFHIGAAACAVPGVLAGLHAVHRRFGSMPWRDLLRPAAEAADRGVASSGGQYAVLVAIRDILRHTPEVSAVFWPRGSWSPRASRCASPTSAPTIERLAERPDDLYTGELARAMVDHQHATGGPLTMADLAAYRPVWRRPLEVPYGRHVIMTNPPPSSGGVLIGHMLAVLEGVPGPRPPGRARTLRAYAETMRAAAPDAHGAVHPTALPRRPRAPHAVGRRLSPPAARPSCRRSRASRPRRSPCRPIPGTTHVSVVDRAGNACAFTASNGCHSGVIVPGTGLHLNNMMGEEDLAAGRHMPPGTRLTSMQAPSMAASDGELELVIGSSGSNRLRSAITQVAVNVLDHGMPAQEAVDHPRVHVEGDRLDCEGGIDEAELEVLERWGERLNRFEGLNLYFGGTNIVARPGRPHRGRRRPAPRRRRHRARRLKHVRYLSHRSS